MDTPNIPRGAIGGTHHPRSRPPLAREELDPVRNRPAEMRRPLPAVGDTVGWRQREHGPVRAAVVEAIGSLTDPWADGGEPDQNVWRVVTNPQRAVPLYDALGRYVYELVADPWPLLRLRIDPVETFDADGVKLTSKGRREFGDTREERLAGLCGWLPADQITSEE